MTTDRGAEAEAAYVNDDWQTEDDVLLTERLRTLLGDAVKTVRIARGGRELLIEFEGDRRLFVDSETSLDISVEGGHGDNED